MKLKILIIFAVLSLFWVLSTPVSASDKKIEVDLTTQTVKAYQNNNLIYDFTVSTGRTITPTPNGIFYPWIRLRFTRMTGSDYDLPNVPYVVFFYNEKYSKITGYSFHGTYWHSNFGHPMSHGCINMYTPDAEKIYNWIDLPQSGDPGTPIIISGTTPIN